MKTIASAFIAAKKAFGPALKDKTNPAFRSKYADLGACLEAVEDALLANGIALYQETFDDLTGVTVETVFLHESGESLRCGKLHVPASKQDPQGYGSALTYARRYSLITACGIAPEDDDGNAASKPVKKIIIPASPPTEDLGLSSETLVFINEMSVDIIGMVKDGKAKEALAMVHAAALDDDQRIALNNLLDSKTRSAMKAVKDSQFIGA